MPRDRLGKVDAALGRKAQSRATCIAMASAHDLTVTSMACIPSGRSRSAAGRLKPRMARDGHGDLVLLEPRSSGDDRADQERARDHRDPQSRAGGNPATFTCMSGTCDPAKLATR